uniref:glycosyltransferase n=1 Tax=Gordonia sp. B7-2 TaxID=3420932 RepID=UPI003D942241
MCASDLWHGAVTIGSAAAVGSLVLTAYNAVTVRRPNPHSDPAPEPITVLLPVRDEVDHVAGCVASICAALDRWPGRGRLIVLDDESTDGTGELVADAAANDPRIEAVNGSATPPDWLGKPWACAQLAAHAVDSDSYARDGVLVFVDADVRVEPAAFVASIALMRDTGLDLISPYPRQQADTVAERLVQPLLQWSWMSTLPLRLAERTPRPSLSAANGQFLIVDANAYRRAGGHHAVRGEVLEDIALLRAIKRSGGRGVVVEGSRVATCRMYDGGRELRHGYRKSLWSAFGSPAGGVAVTCLLGMTYVLPAIAMMCGSRTGLVGYLAGVASRSIVATTTRGRWWPDAAVHPMSVVVLAALTADSLVAQRRGVLRWKGRAVTANR